MTVIWKNSGLHSDLIIHTILLTLPAGNDEDLPFLVRNLTYMGRTKICKIIELNFPNRLQIQGTGKGDIELKTAVGIIPSFSLCVACG